MEGLTQVGYIRRNWIDFTQYPIWKMTEEEMVKLKNHKCDYNRWDTDGQNDQVTFKTKIDFNDHSWREFYDPSRFSYICIGCCKYLIENFSDEAKSKSCGIAYGCR